MPGKPTALLLEPHQDDAALFAAFTCIRYRPHIVTVLRSVNQERMGITNDERNLEADKAAEILGCTREQWNEPDDSPDWEAVSRALEHVRDTTEPETVFAPWPENGGHPQHNHIGIQARRIFAGRVVFYTTYRYGGPKTVGIPVDYEPAWVLLKLRALACFRSQIERGPHRFFMHDLYEYTAK